MKLKPVFLINLSFTLPIEAFKIPISKNIIYYSKDLRNIGIRYYSKKSWCKI